MTADFDLDLVRDVAKAMPAIPQPLSVRRARIWFCRYRTLAPLSSCEAVEDLAVAGWPDESFDILLPLVRLKRLYVVHMPDVGDLSALARLPALEELSLQTLPSWDSSSKRTVVQSIAPLAGAPNLKRLELFGVTPPDRSLAALENAASIVSARFSGYPKREIERFFAQTGLDRSGAPLWFQP